MIGTTLVEMRNAVYNSMLTGTLSQGDAMAYMYLKLSTITERLSETWQSYNRIIGAAGTEITPLSLADITLSHDPMLHLQIGTDVPGDQDQFIMSYICSIYRYARANSPEYRTLLSNSIREFLRALPGAEFRPVLMLFPGAVNVGRGWENNKEYCKLMCIIDMFFFKFPNNDLSKVRFGTQASRHKDCAALTIYMTTFLQLGLEDAADLLAWLFTNSLEKDALTMFRQNEEYDIRDSYFPYQVDLDLVTKSAYSTVACPSIYFLCSSILAINNNNRGLHARFTLQQDVNNVLCNAKLIAYAFTTSSDLDLKYAMNTAPVVANEDDEDLGLNVLEKPTTKDPRDWLTYYTASEASRIIVDNFTRARINQSTTLRQNSVGMYIRNNTTEL